MKHIEQAWKELEALAIPKNASENQRTETRKAFFAGASTVFGLVTSNPSTDLLDELYEEISAFGESLGVEAIGKGVGDA